VTYDDTRMRDAVESCREWTTDLVKKWDDLATSIARKIDHEKYDGEAMLDAWARTTRLTAETGVQMWAQALAVGRLLSGEQYERKKRDSDPFESPLSGATLELEGPLVGYETGQQMPADVDPGQLPEGQTTFVLHADTTDFPGDIYFGKVRASRGAETAHVEVDISF
jgi:hypothetical protein